MTEGSSEVANSVQSAELTTTITASEPPKAPQPQEKIKELNLLPGQELIKEGKDLPYIEIEGTTFGHGESETLLIINQQGEVIATTGTAGFDNYGDLDDDTRYDRLQAEKDMRAYLDSHGLQSYMMVEHYVNSDQRALLKDVEVDLKDLTGGRGLLDYQNNNGIGGNYSKETPTFNGAVGVELYRNAGTSGERGIRELANLVGDPVFQERFVKVQTASEKEQLNAVDKELDKAVDAELRPLIEQAAMQQLALTDINEAKKLGKAWGDALRNVSTVSLKVGETQQQLSIEDTVDQEGTQTQGARSLLKQQQQSLFEARKATAEKVLSESDDKQREAITRLQLEIEQSKDNPDFKAAMEVWGRSPDSKGHRGIDGNGLNAGVIHYFEYRADAAKNGRYKNGDSEVNVKGFIDYSNRVKALVDNSTNNPDVQMSGVIEDEHGQRRMYILTKDGNKVVGFMRSGEAMQVITIISGANEKGVQKDIDGELAQDPNDPKEKERLNHLAGGRKKVS